jgi:hypothetical protein
VLDVYYRLHHNDNVEEPVPFTVVLQTRLRFNSRLTSLLSAADASLGISSITKQGEEPAQKQTDEPNSEPKEEVEEEQQHEDEHADEHEEPEEDLVGDESVEAAISQAVESTGDEVEDDHVLEETEAQDDQVVDLESSSAAQLSNAADQDDDDLIDFTDDEDEGTHDSGTSTATIGKDQIAPVVEINGQYIQEIDNLDNWLTDLDDEPLTEIKQAEPKLAENEEEESEEVVGVTDGVEHIDESEHADVEDDEADYDWLEDKAETAPTTQKEDELEVDLIFDEDEEEEGEIEEESSKPASPLGKRSFDEHAEGSNGLGDDQGKQDSTSMWLKTNCYLEPKRVKQSSPEQTG